mmetsp:Transcript_18494/g.40895  ORF Transcript_18494/g.40895 Transcript_18494/m.40895 type:complete len:207 (+) Transcript_18494:1122-1742(+)
MLLRDIKATSDHPPPDHSLHKAQPKQPSKPQAQRRFHSLPRDQHPQRNGEEHPRPPAPHAVEPLHKVDLLEFVEGHQSVVEPLVFRVLLVDLEFFLPLLLGARQRCPLPLPGSHAQTTASEPGVSPNQNHREQESSGPRQPYSNVLLISRLHQRVRGDHLSSRGEATDRGPHHGHGLIQERAEGRTARPAGCQGAQPTAEEGHGFS